MSAYLTKVKISLFLLMAALPLFSWAQDGTLSNPLNFGEDGENGIADLLLAILNMLQIIAIPIIVFFVIYAGFLYVMARGNPESIQKASKALMYAIIGAVIILGAEVIGWIVQNTAESFKT